MTLGVLEEAGIRNNIDDFVLSDYDIESPIFFNDDGEPDPWEDSRVKLTFLGNRPSIKKTKDPTLYFLLEDTTSPVNVTKQRYKTIYFSINQKSIAGRYWDNTLITNKDTRISVGKTLKRTVPFEAKGRFYWSLYPKSLCDMVCYLTKPQIHKESNHHEEVSNLYRELREHFDYAMDSTEKIWRPLALPRRMFSGKEKGIVLFSIHISTGVITPAFATYLLQSVSNKIMDLPHSFEISMYALMIGAGMVGAIKAGIDVYKENYTSVER